MYLEYLPPNQDLRKEVEEITKIQPSVDLKKTLAEQGKALRGLNGRWNGQLTKDFKTEITTMIDLTNEPIVVGGMPALPNPDAFDSSSKDQMDKYKEVVGKVFEAMKDWNVRKESYQGKPEGETDVNHRYMKVTQCLNMLVDWLTPIDKKVLSMPSGETIVCMDDGTFPGHMVAEVGKHRKDVDKAKYFSSLNYRANQQGFGIFVPPPVLRETEERLGYTLPTPAALKGLELKKKFKENIPEQAKAYKGLPTKDELEMMTKSQLLVLVDRANINSKRPIVADKKMSNNKIIEGILNGQ